MKKIFTILIALLAVVGVKAQTGIKLTFNQVENETPAIADDGTVSGISVNVSAVDGTTDVSGVTATINKVYFSGVKAFQGDNVCSDYTILGPDDSFTNGEGSYGNYYITISGLKGVLPTFNNITLSVEALNRTGLYQGNYTGPIFSETVSTATSISSSEPKVEGDSVVFATQSSIQLAYGNGSTETGANGNTKNKKIINFWNRAGITVDNDEIILIVNVTKTNGTGCFFGLEDVTITNEPTTYTLTSVGAPAGTTYSIDDTAITDNTFPAYPSNLTDNYVTVTFPNGTSGYSVLSQAHSESDSTATGTYTITFTYNGTVDFTEYIGKKAAFSYPASSVEAGKWYLLCQDRGSSGGRGEDGYVYDNGGTYYKAIASNFTTGTTLSTDNQVYLFQFIPTTTDGVYYIQNADGSFFGVDGNISASATGYPYNVRNISDIYFYMQCATNNMVVDNNGNTHNLSFWGTTPPTGTSGNNVWRFFPVEFVDNVYTVTWNIKESEEGETLVTGTSNVVEGESVTFDASTCLSSTYPYTSYNNPTVSNVQANVEQTVIATFNTPFTASTSDNVHWYLLKATRGGYYARYDGNTVSYSATATNSNTEYHWSFYGNPISGYTIKNGKAGDGYSLYVSSTANGTVPELSADNSTTWNISNIYASTSGYENSFGFGTGTAFINQYGGITATTLALYNQESDLGAALNVVDPFTADLTAYTAALNTANNFYENAVIGTGIGQYSGSTKEALKEVIDANENKTTADEQSDVDAATSALTTAINKFSITTPSAAMFYRFKSANSNGYLTSPTINSSDKLTASTTNADETTIWFCTASHSGNNNGIISYIAGEYIHPTYNNLVFNASWNGYDWTANTSTVGTYTVFNKSGGYKPLSCTEAGVVANGLWSGGADATQKQYAWYIEEVTSLPVTAHQSGDGKYYATACVPVAVTVDGATAYKVTTANNNDTIAGVAVLEEIGTTVPANTPMLLIGSQENVTLNITESDATAPTDNILTGASTATEVVDGNYYFGQNDNVPGFYKVNYDNTGSTRIYITNRAYLTTVGDATTSQAKGFTFVFGDDDPTGIGSATASDEILQNSVRYNLQGQRVDESYKGIVIIGGKKYLIK